ncbi:hypothetical protein D3C81_1663880 [compost metagenome]
MDIFQHHGELIAAQPRHDIDVPQAAFEPAGNGGQCAVADHVPQAVIDVLEVVKVQEQDRHLQAGALAAGNGLGQPLAKQHPVRQIGQRVMGGQVTL